VTFSATIILHAIIIHGIIFETAKRYLLKFNLRITALLYGMVFAA